MTGITPVTIFAATFSILSIVLSIFEHISARVLLNTETILIIKMELDWQEISMLNSYKFKKIENLRQPVSHEIAKVIDIDHRLIELLLPIQTKDGMLITFHIRSDATQASEIMNKIKQDVRSGHLSNALFNCWCKHKAAVSGIRHKPKIGNIETKEIHPEKNIRGQAHDVAAVISMKRATKKNVFQLDSNVNVLPVGRINSNTGSMNIHSNAIVTPGDYQMENDGEAIARSQSNSASHDQGRMNNVKNMTDVNNNNGARLSRQIEISGAGSGGGVNGGDDDVGVVIQIAKENNATANRNDVDGAGITKGYDVNAQFVGEINLNHQKTDGSEGYERLMTQPAKLEPGK